MELGNIAGLLDPLIETAGGMGGTFIPIGRVLLALSVVLALLFAVYDWWMGAVSGAVSRAVRASIILTIPLFLLSGDNWTGSMKTFSNFFASELTAPVLKSAGHSNGPEAIKETITRISKSMFPNARAAEDNRSTWEKVREFLVSEQTIGGAVFSALTEAFFELLLFVISAVLVVALIVALFGPLLALQLGVIFGPLLLAWMPFQPLSHLTRNWFQFMLTQGFALVVGVTMAVIAAASIEAYTNSMMAMGSAPGLPWYEELAAKLGGFMASSAVILFVAFMLFRADDIAAAMLGGGGAGTGGVGAVILNKIAPRGSPRTGGKAKDD